MKSPLEGITVLDLSHALAGPHCSTLLADFGARVIKLEPRSGDIARAWGAPLPGNETSYFVGLHRNKAGISIDLKHPDGKALFRRLLTKADVLLENFRPGALRKLGFGYDELKQDFPGLVYCSISGFGQNGPYQDRAALDLILQAESGMISVTGAPDSHGARCGVSVADLTAGMYAALGIVMALRARDHTGRGQFVDISMLEGQMSLLGVNISSFLTDGEIPRPMGTAYKALLPYQTYPTATRDMAIAVGSEKLWKIFCPLIGHPELTDDPRFRTNLERSRNRAALDAILEPTFLTRSYEEWEALFLQAGVPIGSVNNMAELIEHPQVVARGAIVDMEHPRAGPVRMVNVPFRLSETPGSVRTPAPALGEHTAQTLRDLLEMPDEEIARLAASGAIYTGEQA
ncbi:MAG: CaiB/BaiF CoA-transferase family protein [Burkholderiaceae bacterium]